MAEQQLAISKSPTELSIPDTSFHQFAIEKFDQLPRDRVVLFDHQTQQQWTTSAFVSDCFRLSAALRHHLNLRPTQICLIHLPNCPQYMIICLAVSINSCIISTANVAMTEDELERQIRHSRPSLLFCDDHNLNKVTNAAQRAQVDVKLVVLTNNCSAQPWSHSNSNCFTYNGLVQMYSNQSRTSLQEYFKGESGKPTDALLLLYSSGTTGLPKGVLMSHTAWLAGLVVFTSAKYNFPNTGHVIGLIPFAHCFGLEVFLSVMMRGCTLVPMPRYKHEVLLQWLQLYKTGAAPLHVSLAHQLHQRLPNLHNVLQVYGMTEFNFMACAHINDPPRTREQKIASVGRVVPNVTIRIVDASTGSICRINEPGEVQASGPNRMIGYMNNAEATNQYFTHDRDGRLWAKTGDVGYLDENGLLFVVDRSKDTIKVRGMQVSPSELENVLLTHPQIVDCAVVGVEDSYSGQVPRAYVKTTTALTEHEVKEFVKDKVSPHKRLTGGVCFVNDIPRSPSGKMLKRLLREINDTRPVAKL